MSTDLRPIAAPDLQPLRNSFDYDQLESDLKESFMAVFNNYIRPRERQVNLTGMPHLGDTDLIERTLKDYGLAIVRRDATRTAFLLKAARARNPRRGMIFLRQYLQSAWPGVWKVEPLWHPLGTAAKYPADRRPLTSVSLSANVQAVYGDEMSEDGLPAVYRTDWQGRTKIYPYARTNLINQSGIMAGWVVGPNSAVVSNGTLFGPDGVAAASSYKNNGTAGNSYVTVSARPTLKANTWYTVSVWMRLVNGVAPTSGRILSVGYTNDSTNTERRADVLYANNTIGAGWTRYSVTFFNVLAGYLSNTYVHADSSSTAEVSPSGLMYEEGKFATRLIPTTGAAASATDYTIDAATGIATFPDGVTPPSPLTYFLTGRIRVTLPVSSDNGLGLVEIAKAFRATLAARLMLELELSTVFENIGAAEHGLSLAGAAKGVMPFTAIGTLTK